MKTETALLIGLGAVAVGVGVYAFAVRPAVAAGRPAFNPAAQPTSNPAAQPATPGASAPGSGGSPTPSTPSAPTGSTYTLGDRCRDLSAQKLTFQNELNSAQSRIAPLVESVRAEIIQVADYSGGCTQILFNRYCGPGFDIRIDELTKFASGELTYTPDYFNEDSEPERKIANVRRQVLILVGTVNQRRADLDSINAELQQLRKAGVTC